MEKAELEKKWKELREKYNKLVDGRCLLYKLDVFEFRRDTKWFNATSKRILSQIETVRKKLHKFDPETHIFTQNKTDGFRRGLTRRGDVGFLVCCQCQGLIKAKRETQKTDFLKCSEHRGMKLYGYIYPTETKIVY